MSLPDWQLPPGVDRGLWDYLHAADMVAGYDAQMAASPLAAADVAFCDKWFPTPGRLLDLGCGTGRLCRHFAVKGYDCVGVDLSDEMLKSAEKSAAEANCSVRWIRSNLVELDDVVAASFDYAACLFSTLGMVRGRDNRDRVLRNAFRLLKPGGRLVVHVHHRFYEGLGRAEIWRQRWRTFFGRPDAGDITRPQAYGGGPLTLHHFTDKEVIMDLASNGLFPCEVRRIDSTGCEARSSGKTYGYLIAAEREAARS